MTGLRIATLISPPADSQMKTNLIVWATTQNYKLKRSKLVRTLHHDLHPIVHPHLAFQHSSWPILSGSTVCQRKFPGSMSPGRKWKRRSGAVASSPVLVLHLASALHHRLRRDSALAPLYPSPGPLSPSLYRLYPFRREGLNPRHLPPRRMPNVTWH